MACGSQRGPGLETPGSVRRWSAAVGSGYITGPHRRAAACSRVGSDKRSCDLVGIFNVCSDAKRGLLEAGALSLAGKTPPPPHHARCSPHPTQGGPL